MHYYYDYHYDSFNLYYLFFEILQKLCGDILNIFVFIMISKNYTLLNRLLNKID